MAATLLKQLIYQIGALPAQLLILYQDSKAGFPPKPSALLDLIATCVAQFSSCHVLFDGLDECTDSQQDEIISLIRQLRITSMRIFLTSQPQLSPRIAELGEHSTCEIIASEGDLENYIKQRFEVAKTEIKDPLLKELVSGAEGMCVFCLGAVDIIGSYL